MRLEALEQLFFNVFDVDEPVPTSDIAVFTGTLGAPRHDCDIWTPDTRWLMTATYWCETMWKEAAISKILCNY
jgi:hypothetical protein